MSRYQDVSYIGFRGYIGFDTGFITYQSQAKHGASEA